MRKVNITAVIFKIGSTYRHLDRVADVFVVVVAICRWSAKCGVGISMMEVPGCQDTGLSVAYTRSQKYTARGDMLRDPAKASDFRLHDGRCA